LKKKLYFRNMELIWYNNPNHILEFFRKHMRECKILTFLNENDRREYFGSIHYRSDIEKLTNKKYEQLEVLNDYTISKLGETAIYTRNTIYTLSEKYKIFSELLEFFEIDENSNSSDFSRDVATNWNDDYYFITLVYKGIYIGSIWFFVNWEDSYGVIIGIRSSISYLYAKKYIDLGKISYYLIGGITEFCKLNGIKTIYSDPLENMKEILIKHYGFKEEIVDHRVRNFTGFGFHFDPIGYDEKSGESYHMKPTFTVKHIN